jgi:hypothetical protein
VETKAHLCFLKKVRGRCGSVYGTKGAVDRKSLGTTDLQHSLLVYDKMHSKVVITLAEKYPSLWSVTLCSLVNSHQCSEGANGPHLHGLSRPRRVHTPEDLNNQHIVRTLYLSTSVFLILRQFISVLLWTIRITVNPVKHNNCLFQC